MYAIFDKHMTWDMYGKRAVATEDLAAAIFDKMSLTPEYLKFLTLPLYEAME